MYAVGYLRVSTVGQLDGYGLDAQEAKIREYARQSGITLTRIFREEGVSGTNELVDRIALLDLMRYIEDDAVRMVLIPQLSRLARDLMIQESILRDLWRMDVTVVSVDEPDLCSNDPTRKLVRQIMGAINEYDRAMIVLRLRGGRIAKARQGGHAVGPAPMGYRTAEVDGRRVLTKHDEETTTIRYVFALHDKHLSYNKIAERLNSEGVKPKRWTPERPTRFYASTVQKIVQNPKYQGVVRYHEGGKVVAEASNTALKIV